MEILRKGKFEKIRFFSRGWLCRWDGWEKLGKLISSWSSSFEYIEIKNDSVTIIIAEEEVEDFLNAYKEAFGVEEVLPKEEIEKQIQFLCRPIKEIGLSIRSYNCLRAGEIRFVLDLVSYNSTDLIRFKSLGKKSLREIQDLLHKNKLFLGMGTEKAICVEAKRRIESR